MRYMTMRYMLVVDWSDNSGKIERTDSLVNALTAAAIYLIDPDCQHLNIFDRRTKTNILQWTR